jgi:hypothetical protein
MKSAFLALAFGQKTLVLGERISHRGDSADNEALPAIAAQLGLNRHHAREETGSAHWPAEGVGDCGAEQQNGESVFGAAGPTRADADYAAYCWLTSHSHFCFAWKPDETGDYRRVHPAQGFEAAQVSVADGAG